MSSTRFDWLSSICKRINISQKTSYKWHIKKSSRCKVNPDYKVNLYGSYCTGLCLPWRDIDTVIINEHGHNDEYFLSKLQ